MNQIESDQIITKLFKLALNRAVACESRIESDCFVGKICTPLSAPCRLKSPHDTNTSMLLNCHMVRQQVLLEQKDSLHYSSKLGF